VFGSFPDPLSIFLWFHNAEPESLFIPSRGITKSDPNLLHHLVLSLTISERTVCLQSNSTTCRCPYENPMVSTKSYLSNAQARHVAESCPPDSKTIAVFVLSIGPDTPIFQVPRRLCLFPSFLFWFYQHAFRHLRNAHECWLTRE